MSLLRRGQQWSTFTRIWHIYDAKWQDPYKSAERIKHYLSGTYKPIYHPLNYSCDHVIIINSKDIALAGNEWQKRVYFHHTTYHGGATWTLAWEVHDKDPTMIMKRAVYSSMKGTLQRRHLMQLLHVFPDNNVPEEMLQNVTHQIKQLRQVPTRLDHISLEEVAQFPRLIEYPTSYILR